MNSLKVKDLVTEMLENFYLQYDIYLEMSAFAKKQLDLLGGNTVYSNVNKLDDLLEKRKACIEKSDLISRKNKELQKKVNRELDMEEFFLSKLPGHIEEKQYNALEKIVSETACLLNSISATDEQSHILIKQQLNENNKINERTNSKDASNAYREAMNLGKNLRNS